MDTTPSTVPTPSSRSHQRQAFWQIVFPLILASGSLLIFAFFLIAGGETQTRLLADIAIIVLLMPPLFWLLLGILALGFAITMLSRLLRVIPHYARQAQEYAARGQWLAQRAADLSVRPIFFIKQGNAILQQIAKIILGKEHVR